MADLILNQQTAIPSEAFITQQTSTPARKNSHHQMKSLYQLFSLTVLVIALSGCATHIGKTTFPAPTAAFAPKPAYAVPFDKVWEASVDALDKNRITALSADKASGIIQTDYIEGPSALLGGGFIGAQGTRYKYNLTLRNQSGGNVKLTVICKLESTIKGGSGASQWTDVSGHNDARIKQLETWLYEEIEKGL